MLIVVDLLYTWSNSLQVPPRNPETIPPQMASSSSSTCQWNYDVFISFKGEEIRNTFIGHLYRALIERGIKTFIDDENLRKGHEISDSLYQAIEESRIFFIVFSEDYADSKWCLDELVKIMDCRKSTGQMVRPVFYNVDSYDVRNQTGTYEVALAKHEKVLKKDNERVRRWRQALTESANLSGWHLANWYGPFHIQKIAKEVSSKLNRARLQVAAYPVGIDSRALSLNLHLSPRQQDVQMVGICGFGGIGKTTIARTVYNQIALDFEGSSFLANVRDSSKPSELVQLQERLLFEVLGDKNLKIGNVYQEDPLIQYRLQSKRVLIVIDDVDHMDQLRHLAGSQNWFGLGSRIIITTRDKHLLEAHGVKAIYEVKKLNDGEARQLFMWYAFKEMPPLVGFEELANEVLWYCNGLPLALIVLGSHLYGRREAAWRRELQTLKRLPHNGIYEILKISYDGLNEYQQAIFLYIAFFFNGKDERYVHNILESCNVYPNTGIPVLVDKCLVTIEDQKVCMHNLIQEMGKEIVRRESLAEPILRSRPWFYEDNLQVLTRKNVPPGNPETIPPQMATSFSSTCHRQWSYDVFISFRGEETRNTFTGHLHRALVERGINTFIDNENLGRGHEISHSLCQAIEESRMSIIVFSKDYAASKWCMDELVKIMDCRRSTRQKVRPVFYNVDPSDVRNQTGTYGVALAKHKKVLKKDNERVRRWRQVLTEAANLSGWHLANGHEPTFIQKIVEEVSSTLNRARLQVATYPVGIDSQVLSLSLHLTQTQEDVLMVGICGFGGIGKTTLAKVIYNQIADDFEGSSFLANVRDSSKPSDLVQLQERLLFEVLGDKNLKVSNVYQGGPLIQYRLQSKRVLIVIDDVDHMDQLRHLAGSRD